MQKKLSRGSFQLSIADTKMMINKSNFIDYSIH